MKKGERPSYLYIAKGDKDSDRAVRLLECSKIYFKKIPINKNGYGKAMFHDLQTTEVPSLITAKSVHIGLRNIESFARKNAFVSSSCAGKAEKVLKQR
jgi:hypothetical protein